MHKLMAFAAAVSVGLLNTVAVHAHEGHIHKVMGTVKAVHAEMNHVEVTTADGKTSDFYVNAATKYSRGKAAASLADLKPGSRVVVETKMEGNKTYATTVKLSAGTANKAAPPAAHKH